jgi:hypothetical protein
MGLSRARSITISAVALVAVAACGMGYTESANATGDVDWREFLAPQIGVHLDHVPEQQAAMQFANEVFADDVVVWAKSHYGNDGDVVVNLKTGWRDVVGDQVDQLIAAAPAPITIREVEHSDAELMANAKLDDPVWESDLAGARAVTASVSPEENKLVIGLTVVNEDTVKAAQAVFGADVLFRQDDAPELASGDQ